MIPLGPCGRARRFRCCCWSRRCWSARSACTSIFTERGVANEIKGFVLLLIAAVLLLGGLRALGAARNPAPAGKERFSSDEIRRRLARLAWLLDSSIPIPGTRLSIGLDALIGLVPFIGDLVGVLASSYILGESRAPRRRPQRAAAHGAQRRDRGRGRAGAARGRCVRRGVEGEPAQRAAARALDGPAAARGARELGAGRRALRWGCWRLWWRALLLMALALRWLVNCC